VIEITKKIEIPKEELEKLYIKKGLSSYKIAKIYKCYPTVIQKRLREYKIPLIHKKNKINISKERLHELYINRKLSTYKIAKLTRIGRTTVYNKLIESGIATRPKKVVEISKSKLKELYSKERLSLSQIAKKYNCSHSIILDKLKKHNIKRRNSFESIAIYSKKKFNGDNIKKTYMIGFRLGDLNVKSYNQNLGVIYIKTNTTKEAQVELIKKVFGGYGHFNVSFKKGIYSVDCGLDNSFAFLLPKKDKVPNWILKNKKYFFSFLAGYSDAEGCIKIYNNMARYRVGSYDKNLLKQVYEKLNEFKLCPKYKMETKADTVYAGVKKNCDFWRVTVNKKVELLRLLGFLEPYMKHSAKLEDLKRAKNNILERIQRFGS